MQANIIFDNVKVYDVNKFDVRLGETFTVELLNTPGVVRWFSDSDPVLAIDVKENEQDPQTSIAVIKATSKGKSEIQLQVNNSIVKTLYIEVYDVQATQLNFIQGKTILKD